MRGRGRRRRRGRGKFDSAPQHNVTGIRYIIWPSMSGTPAARGVSRLLHLQVRGCRWSANGYGRCTAPGMCVSVCLSCVRGDSRGRIREEDLRRWAGTWAGDDGEEVAEEERTWLWKPGIEADALCVFVCCLIRGKSPVFAFDTVLKSAHFDQGTSAPCTMPAAQCANGSSGGCQPELAAPCIFGRRGKPKRYLRLGLGTLPVPAGDGAFTSIHVQGPLPATATLLDVTRRNLYLSFVPINALYPSQKPANLPPR